jgi:ribosomal-protein-alanine N-acetyltransferase
MGDLPRLRRLFAEAAFPFQDEAAKAFRSLPAFAKWLLTTFQVVCLIEAEKTVLGFAGIYDMKPGKSLMLSMVFFSPDDRGKGYGTEALGLLISFIRNRGLAEDVYAEVSCTNAPSLSLLEKAGFEIIRRRDDRLLLSRNLFEGDFP